MSSAEILHNGYNAAADRSDMLFRAAITAFAEIPRPGRAEIARLDDLVMPLLERVSPDSRRFAATTLAEHASAPPGLMRALASDLPEIAEPVLIHSPVLRELDLIVVIARGGRPHARMIARRPNLPPAIRNLLAMLRDPEIEACAIEPGTVAPAADAFETLRAALLDDDPDALARTLGGLFGDAAERPAPDRVPALLARLGLTGEQAFLIAAALHPGAYGDRNAIRRFLDTYAGSGD